MKTWLYDPSINQSVIRSDEPVEVHYHDKGRAIVKGENFFVCRRNGPQEIVVQSDRTPDRAQYSVEILNEQEERNARQPVFYWRARQEHEK
jgi:ABC-type uncharacterized transport system ATPase subunit